MSVRRKMKTRVSSELTKLNAKMTGKAGFTETTQGTHHSTDGYDTNRLLTMQGYGRASV